MTTPQPPQPPDWYRPDRRQVWQECLREIQATGNTNPNPERLDALVGHIMRYREASRLLDQTQILINRDGTPIENPALAILAKEEQAVQRARREFGLTRKTLPPVELEPRQPSEPPTPISQGRWCDQHGRYECVSNRSDATTCHGSPVKGFPRCRKHLGMSLDDPRVLVAQMDRRNPMAGQPKDITPVQALLWRVRVVAGEVERLDTIIASMEGDDLIYGITRVEEKQDFGDTPERVTVREARLHQWLLLRAQRERMLHENCQAAIRAGIQEQVVDLLKQEAATLARVMLLGFERMGIPPDDPRIPVVIPEVVRELAA